jgi:3-hydroxymyristoyl/3-hydroxydecanoyl-(acyl carrier protein) dehydratase
VPSWTLGTRHSALGTMNWLSQLPHQIPFRAASTARWIDDKTIEGSFLCTANEEFPAAIMVAEAMAQLAGGLVFQQAHGFLTGIDECEIDRPIEPGDVVTLSVKLEAEFGGTYRFSGTGAIGGLECARGRFYLAQT